MKNSLNAFFASSKTYLQHFTVALTSLLENNKDLTFNIFLIHDELSTDEFNHVIGFFKNRYHTEITLIDVKHIDFSKFKTAGHYPKYTYFRLFLADIAPDDVKTALFMDVDLIVSGSVKELAEIDLTDKYIYTVREASVDDNVERLVKLGFPVTNYFNAGVMLVNLDLWRKEKLSEKFIHIASEYMDNLDWVDQDILNIAFAGKWNELPRKYNAVHLIKKLADTPVIVHYASYSKPWYYLDTHPYNHLYYDYLKLTPFAKSKPTGFSFKNFILKNGRLFKRQLREIGLLHYK